MKIEEMTVGDIDRIIPLYLDYYNNHEDSCWTEFTARKGIRQVMSIDDSYSLIMYGKDGKMKKNGAEFTANGLHVD